MSQDRLRPAHDPGPWGQAIEGVGLACLYALPLLALFVSPLLYQPYVTPRGFALRAIVGVAFACWACLAAASPHHRPRFSPILACFAAAMVAMAAADALGVDPVHSFLGNFVRMEGYASLLTMFALFIAASSLLTNERRWCVFFGISVGTSALVSLWGLAQLWGVVSAPWGIERLDASFGNPAYLAAYLLMHVFLAAFLLARAKARGVRLSLALVVALDLVVLWLTATRGAVVGVGTGAIVAALVLALSKSATAAQRRGALVALGLILLGTAAFVAARHAPVMTANATLARFAGIDQGDATVDVRLRIWRVALAAIRDRPLFGWGQENFPIAYDAHFDPVLSHASEWADRAHDLVLDWLVAGGLVGGLAYLSLFAAALWTIRRIDSAAARAILGGLVAGYFVNTLFLFDSAMTYLMFAALLAYLHGRVARPIAETAAAPARLRFAVPIATLGLIALLWLGAGGVLAASAMRAALLSAAAPTFVAAAPQGSIDVTPPVSTHEPLVARRDGLLRAIAYGSFGTGDAREALVLSAYELLSSGDPWVREAYAPVAVAEQAKEMARHPTARGLLFLGAVLGLMGRGDDAIAALDEARTLSPTRQSIWQMLATVDQHQGRTADALAAWKTAYALDPSYDVARLDYAAAAIAAGDDATGEQLLVERYGTALVPDERVIDAYAAAKRDDKVVALLRLAVAREPDNPELRKRLAGVLLRSGRGIEAVHEFGQLNRILTRPATPDPAK